MNLVTVTVPLRCRDHHSYIKKRNTVIALSALFTIHPGWTVIDCQEGKIHWGFLSLIKILLDCCSHMWPNYFVWAKGRPSPVIQRRTRICGTLKIKVSHIQHICMFAWLMPGYRHSCRGTQSPHNSAIGFWLIFLFSFTTHSVHPNTWQRAHCLFFYHKGESNHVRVQRTCDWLTLSPRD